MFWVGVSSSPGRYSARALSEPDLEISTIRLFRWTRLTDYVPQILTLISGAGSGKSRRKS